MGMTKNSRTKLLQLACAVALSSACVGPNSPSAPSTTPEAAATPGAAATPPARTPTAWPGGPFTADAGLSGVVFEMTPTGPIPIEDAVVYCELCGMETHSWSRADAHGVYRFAGVWALGGIPTSIWVGKDGYVDPVGLGQPTPPNPTGKGWREVRIDGETRFDLELVRQ